MDLNRLEKFLGTVDLAAYREKYLPIKIVEMDLPKNIQALDLLYAVYWAQRRFIPFESFYKEYETKYHADLETFRKKTQMCEVCFYKGLPARIYRTWASIITQIHAGYVAESVFGKGTVEMSSLLDHLGADFQVTYKNKKLNFQVKKETFSREVRKAKAAKSKLDGQNIAIEYKVPNFEIMQNPVKKRGGYKKAYSDFKLNWLDTGKIKVLQNGFVVFLPAIFSEIKKKIDRA